MFGADAYARTCLAPPDNPSPRPPCNGTGETTDNPVCREVGTKVICDLTTNGSSSSGWAVAIKDSTSSQIWCDDPYCSWGIDGAGHNYFCSWDSLEGTLTDVLLVGTENDDDLFFWYLEPQYDPENLDAWGSGDLWGRMYGAEGDDCMTGSAALSPYFDDLHGHEGGDQISSGDGDDIIHAGDGQDYVYSGPGDDTIWLEGDDDYCESDDGGGYGDDTVFGGGGEDTICTGPGIDLLVGGSSDDQLDAGGDAGDDINGGSHTTEDSCWGDSTPTDCEVFPTEASECPS